MKAMFIKEPKQFIYKNIKKPAISSGEALIKINKIGICGSDIHAYFGQQAFFDYPRIIGHEICGTVEEIENNETIKKGDRVTVMPYFFCNSCIACKNSKENCCEALKVLGVHFDGAAAEYIQVPIQYIIPIQDIDEDNTTLIEPLAIGAHAIRRAEAKKDEKALVLGLGTIGLGIAAILKSKGIQVIGIDVNEERNQYVENKLDIKTINAKNNHMKKKVYDAFEQEYPTLVFDATGNKQSMESCIQYLAHGGKIIFVGLYKGIIELNDIEFHKREATLLKSRAASLEDFNEVINFIKTEKIVPKDFMITHKVKFDQFVEKFESIIHDKALIKCIVEF